MKITKKEYDDYLALKEKFRILKAYAQNEEYISKRIFFIIFGIKVKKDAEKDD